MELTPELTRHIAKLSGLRLSEEELAAMTRDLASIVAYMAALAELDTGAVDARPQPAGTVNVWREDEAAPSAPREDLLQNAPAQRDGFLLVPRLMEGDGTR